MTEPAIAYFSMEIAVDPAMPTYSGGLGILAGDTVSSAADLKIPMAAVTLLHRKGYFDQHLDADGQQTETPVHWNVHDFLEELPQRVSLAIEGRTVFLRAWKYDVIGLTGSCVPVYFLDADLAENSQWDRTLTDFLYGGDSYYRLCQEVILGIGGVRMLRALGHNPIERFHMNEGHASLLTLELLDETAHAAGRNLFNHEDVEIVRKKCVFTTHTPVAAGHDQFPLDLVGRVLGRDDIFSMKEVFCCEGVLNMTFLALNVSHYINGVAKRHGEVSQQMFARYTIDSITNGVHAGHWTSKPFQQLFDQYISGWRADNFSLRYALTIPKQEAWSAHLQAKEELFDYIRRETAMVMDPQMVTLGFARRATAYKRADLVLHDLGRLSALASNAGSLQLVFAGKAHPKDLEGKELIRRIFQAKDRLREHINLVYLPNYDLELGKLITAGVDIWLNTPTPPLEASGTSGMKAAINGVPSLSIMDGWWIEGHIEGVTGWSIGKDHGNHSSATDHSAEDPASLYDKLENVIMPLFYRDREGFINVMLHAIALNGSFFNTQRMLQQYVVKAYFE